MPQTVCVVGAGPAGLAAAKQLLHNVEPGCFQVTIFDPQPRVGGLWPRSKEDNGGLIHPLMLANQSKHTVQFSDLSWPDDVPQIPRAWQIGRYLERYLAKYPGADVRLGHVVVRTELADDGRWTVYTKSDRGFATHSFDRLIVASGFHGEAIWPKQIPRQGEIPIIHSSKYRSLPELLAAGQRKGGKILVVGAQMSGTEIASTIAQQLSSAINSPGEPDIENAEKFSIHHIAHRPSWLIPQFTSPKPAPPFLPLDISAYNLSDRPHPLVSVQDDSSPEALKALNNIYQTALGTDQAEYSPQLKVGEELFVEPPYLCVNPFYADFVRLGTIEVIPGKLTSIDGTTARVDSQQQEITNVAAVILATGFDAAPSLNYLPQFVLEKLSYDPKYPGVPAALAFHATHHPELPTLGFVGFYRSPYWGVIEMHARFIAHLWSTPAISPKLRGILERDDTIRRTLAFRTDSHLPQFPMGDLAFLLQEFSNALGISISEPRPTPLLGNGEILDYLLPARYTTPGSSAEQLAEIGKNLISAHETVIGGLSRGVFVAYAVFRSLLGQWRVERETTFKGGITRRYSGNARFLLRQSTKDGRETLDADDLGLEYLYIEDGELTAKGDDSLQAISHQCIWRFDELADTLSVWFVKPEEPFRADTLWHNINFSPVEGEVKPNGAKGWQGKAISASGETLHNAEYEFTFKAVNLSEWKATSSSKTPDYATAHTTTYRRL